MATDLLAGSSQGLLCDLSGPAVPEGGFIWYGGSKRSQNPQVISKLAADWYSRMSMPHLCLNVLLHIDEPALAALLRTTLAKLSIDVSLM